VEPGVHDVPTRTRLNGRVVRQEIDGWLPHGDIARWPYSLRPDGYYAPDTVRTPVRI
jgi:hypothetical protein